MSEIENASGLATAMTRATMVAVLAERLGMAGKEFHVLNACVTTSERAGVGLFHTLDTALSKPEMWPIIKMAVGIIERQWNEDNGEGCKKLRDMMRQEGVYGDEKADSGS